MNKLYVILSTIIIIYSCGESNEGNIPKPRTFPRVDLPAHKYKKTSMDLPYSFDMPQLYKLEGKNKNNLKIKMGMLNAPPNDATLNMVFHRLDEDTVSLRNLIVVSKRK